MSKIKIVSIILSLVASVIALYLYLTRQCPDGPWWLVILLMVVNVLFVLFNMVANNVEKKNNNKKDKEEDTNW